MGRGRSKAGDGGGGSANIGKTGTGVAIELNGKTRYYRITEANSLLEISGRSSPLNTGRLSAKEFVKKMIDSGKGTYISKAEVKRRVEEKWGERKNRPDYELGNPFGERGRKKTVYRPRRRR